MCCSYIMTEVIAYDCNKEKASFSTGDRAKQDIFVPIDSPRQADSNELYYMVWKASMKGKHQSTTNNITRPTALGLLSNMGAPRLRERCKLQSNPKSWLFKQGGDCGCECMRIWIIWSIGMILIKLQLEDKQKQKLSTIGTEMTVNWDE